MWSKIIKPLCGILLAAIPLASLFGLAQVAYGQGVLLIENERHPVHFPRPFPHPPAPPEVSYKIKEVTVDTKIVDQIAKTQVTQSFVNTGSRQIEVSFIFPLPYDGAIDRLTLMVNEKEYEAKLLPADEARSIYEGYIRKNQDPALLEWMGKGMFKTSIFPIPPGAERKVTLRYSQLLRKDQRLTDYLFPLATAKFTSHAVENIQFNLAIESAVKLKSIYSPTHPVDISRTGDKNATVKFSAKNSVPSIDFRLFFDTDEQQVGASVLSYWPKDENEGFFLMLASPDIKSTMTEESVPKTVIFVVDRSGSMSGKKIEQARESLKFVVNNLRNGDLFNIVAYDSEVDVFRPEVQRYNETTRNEALGFIDGVYAGGSTNISGALTTALNMIQEGAGPSYVVFMTDGLPTAGETNELKLAKLVKDMNKHSVRMINFGVGYDVNSRLLDRLSTENRGQSEYVRPDENIEEHVSRVFRRISAPVLADAKATFDFDGANGNALVNRLYPKDSFDLFEGEQLVLVGRYKQSGAAKIVLTGKVGKEEKKYVFNNDFVAQGQSESSSFVERLWALRRVGEIIDELDLNGQNQELVQELVRLSTEHGILTPYTSFLADDQAPANLAQTSEQLRRASLAVDNLSIADGKAGVAQRGAKADFKNATQLESAKSFAPASAGGFSSRSFGGGAAAPGGLPGAVPGSAATPASAPANASGAARFRDVASDKEVAADSVIQVGKDSIYRRGKTLVASNVSDIDIEKDKEKITLIQRYSKEYFDLVKDNSGDENNLLAQQTADTELVIKLRGKVYRIQ